MRGHLACSFFLCLLSFVTACHGGSSPSGRPDSATTDAPSADAAAGPSFAPVERLLEEAVARGAFQSVAVVVRDRDDREVFRKALGGFDVGQQIAVASASKMVSGLVLFSLIDRGLLSLDTTTGAALGWPAGRDAVNLRHLMSFTSGLAPEPACLLDARTTLAACVDLIRDGLLLATPGKRFDYGGAHLQVAGRMAELATGKSWNELFTEVLSKPLGLSSSPSYFTAPRQKLGGRNPLVAGGLRISTLDYLELLALAFHGGRHRGVALGNPALFDAQTREPFADVVIGNSPAAKAGHPYRYGLAAWLECDAPAQGCGTISSPGAFGFTPWLDRDAGYYAVIATEFTGSSASGVVKESLDLESALQPAIRAALAGGGVGR